MAAAKQTAKDPVDLNIGPAVEDVESKSKVASGKSAKELLSTNSTFASRARATGKRIGSASNKAVTAEESKAK